MKSLYNTWTYLYRMAVSMQFVPNGPEVPNALLQAHEEGRVVFFCGAGISYPAGLRGFQELVDDIYSMLGTSQEKIEESAYSEKRYDTTLGLLERRLPGKIEMRKALKEVLQPNLRRKNAMRTHESLLRLGKTHNEDMRLVTTNFDNIFERVAKRRKLLFNSHIAPMLPIPKNSRWDGLVYLHGLLPQKDDDTALQKLVVTSGDFGLAYLTERWAARFVSELFRNYVVCFVGYSIDDPILRYMMDALAADRMSGEEILPTYAFADYTEDIEKTKDEWGAKGVTPILFEVPAGTYDFSTLHDTIKVWADTYRDGILGKERIVIENAMTKPSESTRQDDFVGRMLWAISDKSGIPAKRFADFDPVPSLDWLYDFIFARYSHNDLIRFGINPSTKIDKELTFGLARRPSPYKLAPPMSLVPDRQVGKWDAVMIHLGRWLIRHLNDPELIVKLTSYVGYPHEDFVRLINDKLSFYDELEKSGKSTELDIIRENAPNAIPEPFMRKLWYLFIIGRVGHSGSYSNIYSWIETLERFGLNTASRFALCELLTPCIMLKHHEFWGEEVPEDLQRRIGIELDFSTKFIYSGIKSLRGKEAWNEVLPSLLVDFEKLLHDALDLLQEVGKANEYSDHSHWDMPSISEHWQNRGFNEWVVLIELVRDAWVAMNSHNTERAKAIAKNWFTFPYPTFKRLALFGASHENCVPSDEWVEWLRVDDARWLWSIGTRREVMRLLILQGRSLTPESKVMLESVILEGPPREMYGENIEDDEWKYIAEHSVWLYLAKLNAGGVVLEAASLEYFEKLTSDNPDFKLSEYEKEEFSHWMSSTGDPDFKESVVIDIAPKEPEELKEWLKKSQKKVKERGLFNNRDTWKDDCATSPDICREALNELAKDDIWPELRWEEALQAWSADDLVYESWGHVAPIVLTMPDEVFEKIVRSVSWWMEKASKSFLPEEAGVYELCHRILAQPFNDEYENRRPVEGAINHPVGHVAETLLNLWFKREPNDDDGLPDEINELFTQMCDVEKVPSRYGRVILASRLISLFRVDRAWTHKYLFPLFDWSLDPTEAKAAWAGFMWAPRLYRPLLIELKVHLLETAEHVKELGDDRRQFVTFLSYVALDLSEEETKEKIKYKTKKDVYTYTEFQTAMHEFSQEDWQEVARTLAQALEGAGDQRTEYLKNRILPFWSKVWPKTNELVSTGISESLARLCIATGDEFPIVLKTVKHWFVPSDRQFYTVRLLKESGLIDSYPDEALFLLDRLLPTNGYLFTDLKSCMDKIVKVKPALKYNKKFKRLEQGFT